MSSHELFRGITKIIERGVERREYGNRAAGIISGADALNLYVLVNGSKVPTRVPKPEGFEASIGNRVVLYRDMRTRQWMVANTSETDQSSANKPLREQDLQIFAQRIEDLQRALQIFQAGNTGGYFSDIGTLHNEITNIDLLYGSLPPEVHFPSVVIGMQQASPTAVDAYPSAVYLFMRLWFDAIKQKSAARLSQPYDRPSLFTNLESIGIVSLVTSRIWATQISVPMYNAFTDDFAWRLAAHWIDRADAFEYRDTVFDKVLNGASGINSTEDAIIQLLQHDLDRDFKKFFAFLRLWGDVASTQFRQTQQTQQTQYQWLTIDANGRISNGAATSTAQSRFSAIYFPGSSSTQTPVVFATPVGGRLFADRVRMKLTELLIEPVSGQAEGRVKIWAENTANMETLIVDGENMPFRLTLPETAPLSLRIECGNPARPFRLTIAGAAELVSQGMGASFQNLSGYQFWAPPQPHTPSQLPPLP